ncbi:hypothetical protein [Streptomyces sp. V3I7]|uniref:hypothetical protein n=1 Tax=Streptomyces sp. V3I7 TaxID=3042278 RepID=UPI002788A3A7|nr:hypothetical protein [Streptomyces sp. V3I7]MDQ0989627.1 hypothetical protein [Streptomyces sp. V3I7]
MGQGSRRTPEHIAEGLAYVCENVDVVRATLDRGPAGGPARLDELLAALRAGENPTALLDGVHRALRAAQDANGVFGRTRSSSMVTAAGVAPGPPYEPVLLCPRSDHPCARYAWPGPGGVPECRVSGEALRLTTLTP